MSDEKIKSLAPVSYTLVASLHHIPSYLTSRIIPLTTVEILLWIPPDNTTKSIIPIIPSIHRLEPIAVTLVGTAPRQELWDSIFKAACGAGHEDCVTQCLLSNVPKTTILNGFFFALKFGHDAIVNMFLSRTTATFQDATANSYTPLQIAAANGYNACLKTLYAHGLFRTVAYGSNPLYMAARNGYVDCMETLLQQAREGDIREQDFNDSLYTAIMNGHVDCVSLLLKYKPSLAELTDREGRSLIHIAAYSNQTECLRFILGIDNAAKTPRLDLRRQTALHKAAYCGNNSIMNLLLAFDPAMINVSDHRDQTALHIAARKGHVDCVRTLLSIEPGLTKMTDNQGQSVLHAAAYAGHVGCVEALLTFDPTLRDLLNEKDRTALFEAASRGHDECVRAFSNFEKVGPWYDTIGDAFDVAIKKGHEKVVHELIAINPDVTRKVDSSGNTPLLVTARRGHGGLSELLLTIDPTCSAQVTNEGNNVLHVAAGRGHGWCVKTVLSHDPKLAEALNKDGNTALHVAAMKGHFHCAELFLSPEIDIVSLCSIHNADGNTVIHLAAKHNQNKDVLRRILALNPALARIPNREGNTALHIAAQAGCAEMIQVLVSSDPALTRIVNKEGNIALFYAAIREGSSPCTQKQNQKGRKQNQVHRMEVIRHQYRQPIVMAVRCTNSYGRFIVRSHTATK
eukprot:PhF_6_TR29378/c0_g2_i2/m.43296